MAREMPSAPSVRSVAQGSKDPERVVAYAKCHPQKRIRREDLEFLVREASRYGMRPIPFAMLIVRDWALTRHPLRLADVVRDPFEELGEVGGSGEG